MIAPGSLNPHLLGGRPVINLVIAANVNNYNLKTAAIAAGWDGVAAADITCAINSGVVVGSATTAGYAFDTGVDYPPTSTINIVNNGTIAGAGGLGGQSGSGNGDSTTAGSNGGDALRAQVPVNVTNNGTIGGGGGGGGGGGNGLQSSGDVCVPGGGGGGGAGAVVGNGGPPGTTCSGAPTIYPTAGQPGTLNTGGVNGIASEFGINPDQTHIAGRGGVGGNLGVSGEAGQNIALGSYRSGYQYGGRAGGAAGRYVNGSANANWLVTGTRLGGAV